MKLIVGLGNPGRAYARSRHNIGYSVVKAIAQGQGAAFKKESRIPALSSRLSFAGQDVVLALPLTFMNLLGGPVSSLVKKYRISPGNLLVVCDDLDLEFAKMRLRDSGTSAGHRGMGSIIEALGRKDFWRLRIGIGRPENKADVAEYVLAPFAKEEQKELNGMIEQAAGSCLDWIKKSEENK